MRLERPNSWIIYVGSILVLLVSFGATWLLPAPDLFRGLASIPGVGALLSVVFQLWREQRLHERAVELLHRQQDFALATASHMANVAYDKHVAFCESYIERTNQGLADLITMGATSRTLEFAGDLIRIRIRHATWLTAEIETKLIPFEAALRKMGAAAHVLDHLPVGEKRSRVVDEIYNSFGLLTGVDKPRTDEEAEMVPARVIDHLRDVLGIRELTHLRHRAGHLALRRLSESA